VAYLPHYATLFSRMPALANMQNSWPAQMAVKPVLGFAKGRKLPKWRRAVPLDEGPADGKPVVLFADTFNRYFEPENLRAACAVLAAGGYRIHHAAPVDGKRPLCCGRTFLSAGLVDKARAEMHRTLDALEPYLAQGIPVVGLEPSCLLTFRDELPALLPGERAERLSKQTFLFEEFVAAEAARGGFGVAFEARAKEAHLHGHCHQKAFGTMGAVERVLKLVPGLAVKPVEAGCCGMAGAFGYKAATEEVSKAMAEAALLPAVRAAPEDAAIVACGFSCRAQIRDGAGREAVHVARVLAEALP
jgi:Fe-S oxidoreductase